MEDLHESASSNRPSSPPVSKTLSGSSNPNHPALPPLVTSPPPKRSELQRPQPSSDHHRLTRPHTSEASGDPSRPPSDVFPIFHSTLPYAIVRDFAYPAADALHYGPPPAPSEASSGASTPISEAQPYSSDLSWDSRGHWSAGTWVDEAFHERDQLPSVTLGDGPPWSEDEDLHSPVVINSRRRKTKSSGGGREGEYGRGRGRNSTRGNQPDSDLMMPSNYSEDGGVYPGTNGDDPEFYYYNEGDGSIHGSGEDYADYTSERRHSRLAAPYNVPGQRDSHFATTLPNRSYSQPGTVYAPRDSPSEPYDSPSLDRNDSRYSRDYQFTIASPDEEMHGKAVALFDFERENENELPLVEGQVIWVSYRHGQGWLVAEDPKTGESGLVPEEYVRLLRDIEGGWTTEAVEGFSSNAQPTSPDENTPVQKDQPPLEGSTHMSSGSNGQHRPSMVSTFSTSSKDLNPYPHHLLGTQAGQAPPQVVHYQGQRGGSQVSTPTLTSPSEVRGLLGRSASSKSQTARTKTDSPTRVRQQSPIRETATDRSEEEPKKT